MTKNIEQVVSAANGKSSTSYRAKDKTKPYPSGGRGGLKAVPVQQARVRVEEERETAPFYVLHMSPWQATRCAKSGIGAVLNA